VSSPQRDHTGDQGVDLHGGAVEIHAMVEDGPEPLRESDRGVVVRLDLSTGSTKVPSRPASTLVVGHDTG